MQQVSSSMIKEIGFTGDNGENVLVTPEVTVKLPGTLAVRYKPSKTDPDGKLYLYYPVDQRYFHSLIEADSIGIKFSKDKNIFDTWTFEDGKQVRNLIVDDTYPDDLTFGATTPNIYAS